MRVEGCRELLIHPLLHVIETRCKGICTADLKVTNTQRRPRIHDGLAKLRNLIAC